ncbi:MAG: zinc-ribbon domain-containing protein, partial [Pseudomonadota bacterium]
MPGLVGKSGAPVRLICPNCDAEYEVPDSVIPAEGRDVQCSNCGTTWFFDPSAPVADDIVDDPGEPEADP